MNSTWFSKLFWRVIWGKPKKEITPLRNPPPKVYGPKPKKINKYQKDKK